MFANALTASRSAVALFLLQGAAVAQVVINEIHYAPADKTKPLEFVELYNSGDAPAEIGQWRFSDGVKFTFPSGATIAPKAFVCVAANPDAFKKAFGTEAFGPWGGKLKNGGERVALVNAAGEKVDGVKYDVGHPWPTQAHGKGPSLELINARLDRGSAGSWRAGGPTPGKANSVTADNASPAFGEVVHSPASPRSGEPIVITARISDPDGVASVKLAYQVMEPGSYIRLKDERFEKEWTELPMRDDGREGDLAAADGVFTASLPADLARHRRLIRYRVFATDAAGMSGRAPGDGDSVPNFALFVYDGLPAWKGASQPGATEPLVFEADFLKSLPTIHLIANAEDVKRSQWDGGWNHRRCSGTLVFDGRVYDHVSFHNRGRASVYNTGKNKWGFHFPEGHELPMWDPTGRKLKKTWDSFSMNACASPWVPANRGMTGLEEWFSSRIFELAEVPTPRHIPLHFRVVDAAEEAPDKDQFGGDLWGVYMAIEDADGSFLDERGLADGNIYSPESGKKHQAPDHPKDNKDLDQFMGQSQGGQRDVAWWRQHWNLPVFYSFRAANRITGNVDLREGANHLLYHAPDGRWSPIPWDLDMMLIPRTHQSGRIGQDRCVEHQELKIEYANRCRELLDLLLADTSPGGGQVGQLVDEYGALIRPHAGKPSWADLDKAMWNHHPRTGDKGGFYRNPVHDDRGGGRWVRQLASPDFAGMSKFLLDYASNARPTDIPWKLNDGDPRGYGYEYLRSDAEDAEAPERPAIAYKGAPNFPSNALTFECSPFKASQGESTFAAMQWRLGEISGPGVSGWMPGQPRRYEIEPLWTSSEIATFLPMQQIPGHIPERGKTYRVRVRLKDLSGRWSRWSEPVTFLAGAPVLAR